MPAEWEKQKSTMLGWPYNKADWPGRFDKIPNGFAKIISNLSVSQRVNILVKNSNSKRKIKVFLSKYEINLKNISIKELKSLKLQEHGFFSLKNSEKIIKQIQDKFLKKSK